MWFGFQQRSKKAEGKVNMRGILKWKVEECKVSNIHQLCDVIMEEWKRTPVATCGALLNSMPKRVKAVLENNGGQILDTTKHVSCLSPSLCVHSTLQFAFNVSLCPF